MNLGNNDSLSPLCLTRKPYWLLAICGFMRPSDIAQLDNACTTIRDSILHLVVIAPKEKRLGRCIERSIAIKPHNNGLLCPVLTYQSYKSRIAPSTCIHQHPTIAHIQIHRLIRDIQSYIVPINDKRISNLIRYINNMIPCPQGIPRPKARALGPTFALEVGASVDDILAHGSWRSSTVFDTFYCLSRRTANNFSNSALPVSSGPLNTQQESLKNEG
ncbi:hypothetical protein BDF14DRAFT_1819629 [Spinellus fusiger]|nr:hypothetical protein BDF14DRAFT_1819629 [Spinellus fusiger]